VLIQVAKICPEILHVCLVVEMFESVQYQGQVDDEGREQRYKCKQEKGYQYLCS
jgi:hypothetical protein